ncbi:TSR1 ribosome maturation factor [Phyllostomus discolor]|uniref:Pre-rRNA-processing protein TSR1 homolog n=1 Tax=Phyllostomus discolor TaxID=89673 RepID=A0A834DZ24_9CHIR|nr:TSR1 ribosome maturation factor [Phyllostomus discolor]
MAAHRSGPLKQQNKAHKGGRHRGRGSAQRDGKGRLALKSLSKKVRKELSRVDQRHRASQLRKQKKEAVLAEKRQLGSKDGPPHQVLVVPLHNRISLPEAFRLLQDRDTGTVHLNERGSTHSFMLLCPILKHRWLFTSASPGDLHTVLDLAKVADTILFLLDPMEGEQTWPTEEELSEANDILKENSKVVKKVPKGTSSYQAEWILDEDCESGGEGDEYDDIEHEDFMEEESQDESSEEEEEEECETMTIGESVRDDLYDEKVDEEAEEKMLEKYKQERLEEMFPDEVDTPRDVAARIRFQKYRGLKSFRTSPWDPKENLPRDYARIFQFQNFTNTRKRVFKGIEEKEVEGAEVGWYVTLHVSEVPVSVAEHFQRGAPLIAFSLLPHEQKMSVLNMVVSRHPGNTEPVKAKEELIFHCGFRRFRASPLFSQHTAADKHKFQRFLTADMALVVTVYAPITLPPASVLLFKQNSNGMHSLIATGHLLSVDPDRMVIKRVVLSGHPFKIFTKMAVVRYMFFNREDVLWFKPVELRTKWGRRGHIKEPVGTHGHMKCSFDGKLKSQDTVLMNLYKRVFPKWTYDPYVPEPVPWVKSEISSKMPEVDME